MPNNDNNNTFLKQIRERSNNTLLELADFRPGADKSISPELDAIRRLSLQIIEKTDEIAHKQSRKLTAEASAG